MKDYSFIIFCSNCETPLVDIWVTKETSKVTKFRAHCPHCGDKSYWKEIKGQFALGITENTDLGPMEYSENLDILEVKCRKK